MVSTTVTEPTHYLINGTLDLCATRYEETLSSFSGKIYLFQHFFLLFAPNETTTCEYQVLISQLQWLLVEVVSYFLFYICVSLRFNVVLLKFQ